MNFELLTSQSKLELNSFTILMREALREPLDNLSVLS